MSTQPLPSNPPAQVADSAEAEPNADAIWTPEYRLRIISTLSFCIRTPAPPMKVIPIAEAINFISAWSGGTLEINRPTINDIYRSATGHDLP